MANKVVSNTAPLIHLKEIDLINALNIFEEILIPPEVENEIKNNNLPEVLERIKVINLNSKWKDTANILVNEFSLDLGEAEAIALALQEKADYFLTDDLDARLVASRYNLEVHGTIGIILRAFRERLLDKKLAIKKVNEIYFKSSLFITRNLVDDIIEEINRFLKER